MGKRTGTAIWIESRGRWQIKVQKDGQRRAFYSFKPGRAGQREANAKADAWLDDGIVSTSTKVSKLYADWLEELSCTAGTSYLTECQKYGEYYILPVCGGLKIADLTEAHLQTVLNKAYKQGCLKKDRKRKPLGRPLSKKTLQGIRSVERAFVKWCRLHKCSADASRVISFDSFSALFSPDTGSAKRADSIVRTVFANRFVKSRVRFSRLGGDGMPPEALAFIKRYFPEAQISHIKIEKEFLRVEKYEVLLTDRTEVEFDRKGVWTEVECDHVQVPLGLLPAYVSEYVEKHFPGAFVVKLERKRKELEVDLDNDLSLTFNHKGDLIDIDD